MFLQSYPGTFNQSYICEIIPTPYDPFYILAVNQMPSGYDPDHRKESHLWGPVNPFCPALEGGTLLVQNNCRKKNGDSRALVWDHGYTRCSSSRKRRDDSLLPQCRSGRLFLHQSSFKTTTLALESLRCLGPDGDRDVCEGEDNEGTQIKRIVNERIVQTVPIPRRVGFQHTKTRAFGFLMVDIQ